MTALMIVLILWAAFWVPVLARNYWVYRSRTRLLREDYAAYRRLPTYGEMMSRFWVWDARRFVRKAR